MATDELKSELKMARCTLCRAVLVHPVLLIPCQTVCCVACARQIVNRKKACSEGCEHHGKYICSDVSLATAVKLRDMKIVNADQFELICNIQTRLEHLTPVEPDIRLLQASIDAERRLMQKLFPELEQQFAILTRVCFMRPILQFERDKSALLPQAG